MKVKVASRSFFRSRNEFFADSRRRKKEVLQSRETVSVFSAMSFEVFVLIRRCSVERSRKMKNNEIFHFYTIGYDFVNAQYYVFDCVGLL